MNDDVDLSNLDCKLFVDGPFDEPELIDTLVLAVRGEALDDGVRGSGVELIVSANDDADVERRKELPRGFLHFGFIAEVYFAPSVQHGERVTTVTGVLTTLWDSGYAAVAACDYEDELPKSAGVDGTAPWPT
jgi:hypothetical protein